jgi:hypothetical protein
MDKYTDEHIAQILEDWWVAHSNKSNFWNRFQTAKFVKQVLTNTGNFKCAARNKTGTPNNLIKTQPKAKVSESNKGPQQDDDDFLGPPIVLNFKIIDIDTAIRDYDIPRVPICNMAPCHRDKLKKEQLAAAEKLLRDRKIYIFDLTCDTAKYLELLSTGQVNQLSGSQSAI